jgi:uncharacterized membrane protein
MRAGGQEFVPMNHSLTTIIAPAAIVVLSIPMILQKVPRNGFYGFRTPRTLASDAVWFPANRVAGISLACAGTIWIAAGFTIPLLVPASVSDVWVVAIGSAAVGASVLVAFLFLRRIT